MKPLRLLLGLLLLLSPAIFWLLIWRPANARMAISHSRIAEAQARIQELPNFAPLSPKEVAFLEDPAATWKQRIPMIRGDGDRLAHYDLVVTRVSQGFRSAGLRPGGMRSGWDPIHASFTLQQSLTTVPPDLPPAGNLQGGVLSAWVLEVQIDGPTGGLFTGLDQLKRLPPLLEPVGLRWEATPERRAQSLWLRNLVLVPPEGTR
jgi:hypothetical protein